MLTRILRARRSHEDSREPDLGPELPRTAASVRTRLAGGRDLHRVKKDALIQRVEAALRDANERHRLFKLDGHAR